MQLVGLDYGISRETSLTGLKVYVCVCVHSTAICLVTITYQKKKINSQTISQFIPSLTEDLTVSSKEIEGLSLFLIKEKIEDHEKFGKILINSHATWKLILVIFQPFQLQHL